MRREEGKLITIKGRERRGRKNMQHSVIRFVSKVMSNREIQENGQGVGK